MLPDPNAVQIYVDGSSLANRGRGSGYAGYVLYPDNPVEEEIVFAGFRESTNNRMELAAVIAAMEWVRRVRPDTTRVQIFTDSRYVVENCPRAAYWDLRKGRNEYGRPVANVDLWNGFLRAWTTAGVRVEVAWVRGKSTALLRRVDRSAKAAAQSSLRVDRGYRPGKVGRAKTKGGVATMFPAAAQELVIRVYGIKAADRSGENLVKFELSDVAATFFGPKRFAYAEPVVGAQLHRQRLFRVQMNDNPKYPQILRVLEELPLP